MQQQRFWGLSVAALVLGCVTAARVAQADTPKTSKLTQQAEQQAMPTEPTLAAEAGTLNTVPVDQLIERLSSADTAVQLKAIERLGLLGPAAKKAVPALRKLLQSENATVRAEAAWALGKIGPDAKEAVSALAVLLKDPKVKVRAYAARALGQIGSAAQSASEQLIRAAFDKDVVVRREALGALQKIHPPVEKTIPILLKVLDESDPALVVPALHTLAEFGEKALPFLKQLLQNDKACYWACVVLADMGPKAAETVPLVAKLLEHKQPEHRLQALLALAAIGPAAKTVVPKIVQLLEQDSQTAVKYAAAYALGKIGDRQGGLEPLTKVFKSTNDEQLRIIAAWSLLQLGPKDKQLVTAARMTILKGLNSSKQQVRATAVRALVELKPGEEKMSSEEIDEFVKAMQSAPPQVVGAVLDGLAAKGEVVLPALRRALTDQRLRVYAVRVIQRMGPKAASLVPQLLKLLQDPQTDESLRREIHFALGRIGEAAAPAVPELLSALKAASDDLRYSACYALGKIGPAAKQAVPALKQCLAESSDSFMKFACIWALVRIVPNDQQVRQQAVPLLKQRLNDPRPHIRAEAAQTLGLLKQEARSVTAALQKLLNDPDAEVRAAAQEALKQIQ